MLDAGRQHRDALAVVSTLVAASESYRLDRRLLWLTILFGGVAVVSAIAAIFSLANDRSPRLGWAGMAPTRTIDVSAATMEDARGGPSYRGVHQVGDLTD